MDTTLHKRISGQHQTHTSLSNVDRKNTMKEIIINLINQIPNSIKCMNSMQNFQVQIQLLSNPMIMMIYLEMILLVKP